MNILFCSMLLFGMGPQMHDKAMPTMQYYRSFAGYDLPLKLIQPISKEEAISSEGGYLIGYFDENKKIIKIEAMYKNKIKFKHLYEYHPNGKLKRLINSPSEGMDVVKDYDEKGKLLTSK